MIIFRNAASFSCDDEPGFFFYAATKQGVETHFWVKFQLSKRISNSSYASNCILRWCKMINDTGLFWDVS